MTNELPLTPPLPRAPGDAADDTCTVVSDDVVAPAEAAVEPAEHLFGLRRSAERNVGG